MVSEDVTQKFRNDAKASGSMYTAKEREEMLKPYLPAKTTSSSSSEQKPKSRPVRAFITKQIHIFLYNLIHLMFSVYIRLRQFYQNVSFRISSILYYHHRTPELIQNDVKDLKRLPKHLSVILKFQGGSKSSDSLETLLDEVAEISCWCASVGIPLLSVYEKTGVLKRYMGVTHRSVSLKMHAYFGKRRPTLEVKAPHIPAFLNGDNTTEQTTSSALGHLNILLLSADDGRSTMVDLTKTLAEMAQHDRLAPGDISQDLIDAELSESVSGEPDLLVLFGPYVKLDGYPPWQLRVTEIFHCQDNTTVEYLVWLKALHRFAKAQMRFGR